MFHQKGFRDRRTAPRAVCRAAWGPQTHRHLRILGFGRGALPLPGKNVRYRMEKTLPVLLQDRMASPTGFLRPRRTLQALGADGEAGGMPRRGTGPGRSRLGPPRPPLSNSTVPHSGLRALSAGSLLASRRGPSPARQGWSPGR